MSDAIDDGGPAFPAEYECENSKPGDRAWTQHPGMSLRDWFAGQALAGHLAAGLGDGEAWQPGWLSRFAYTVADAMLAARKGGKP